MSKDLYPKKPVLLIDDEESWLESFVFSLEYSGKINNTLKCTDSREALTILDRQEVSLVLLDLTMPHINGQELLPKIFEQQPGIQVVIMSGLNQVETAVQCLKEGAYDYFVKTAEKEQLINGIKKAIEYFELKQENVALQKKLRYSNLNKPEAFAEIVTQSKVMHENFHYLEAVVESHEPILITGESGVGKELIANSIHLLCGLEHPFVALNVAGLDDDNFSDTLFGHIQGAYTGAEKPRAGMIEKAKNGILFLDEIGDLSNSSQVKLLRLLQEGEYFPLGSDVVKQGSARIICATNHDLAQRVEEGLFREDLYYRLFSHHVHIPPLRERTGDIALLLNRFIDDACKSLKKKRPKVPEELKTLLCSYHFPGNIRELRAMTVNAVSMHQSGQLSMSLFKKRIAAKTLFVGRSTGAESSQSAWPFPAGQPLPSFVQADALLITEAMSRAQGNQGIAADMLGVTRQALNRRLQKMSE